MIDQAKKVRHIFELTKRHHINMVHTTNKKEWCSNPDTRTIVVPEVDSNLHYFVCLHEIGHTVDPEASPTWSIFEAFIGGPNMLRGEIHANRFALQNMIGKPCEEIGAGLNQSFGGYWSHCRRYSAALTRREKIWATKILKIAGLK